MATRPGLGSRRNILAGGFGNVLEWYDFGVYGFFAAVIGQQFFPSDDPFASLLSAFGVFAVGYAARPIGGIVLGHIGDKYGRRPVMLLSLGLMGCATFLIGVIPDFDQVGEAAPLLLVALRLLQGFAVSGEYSTSTVFLVEQAPNERRGIVSSWALFGQIFGLLLGSGMGAAVSTVLDTSALHDWGWRLPFLLSAVIAVIGLILRFRLEESPAITGSADDTHIPLARLLRTQWRSIVQYVCLISMGGVGFYLAYVFAVEDLTQHMQVNTAQALDINTLALFAVLVATPLAGALSDRLGRKPLAAIASLGTFVLAWPLWWLMHQPNLALILVGQVGFAVVFATGWSTYALMMTEALPLRARCSVISIGNGIAYGVFGGLTPLVATYLVERTADDFAPVYLLMALALISSVAVLRMQETAPRRIA